jgi:hypothetical protein
MKASPTREWTLCLPRRGQARLCHAEPASGRVPRLARLMALALRLEGLLHCGVVPHQAELARLGQVSRARISQILNLLHLAPDIQEQASLPAGPPSRSRTLASGGFAASVPHVGLAPPAPALASPPPTHFTTL